MVGEIRDLETADIAIKAAQTGHLVLSTLHTNDAPTTLTRLLNMGVAPFNIASSVILITAQRLAALCALQAARGHPSRGAAARRFPRGGPRRNLEAVRPVGCDRRNNTGYKGRVGIYQVMPITDEIQRIIMNDGNAIDIAEQAAARRRRDLRLRTPA
jgi:type IV pilus assembly protein PilB